LQLPAFLVYGLQIHCSHWNTLDSSHPTYLLGLQASFFRMHRLPWEECLLWTSVASRSLLSKGSPCCLAGSSESRDETLFCSLGCQHPAQGLAHDCARPWADPGLGVWNCLASPFPVPSGEAALVRGRFRWPPSPLPLLHETHTPAHKGGGRAGRHEDGDRLKGKVSIWNHSGLEGEESRII